jgi:hypothetical protein
MTEVFFADKDMFMSTRVFDDFFKRGKFVFNFNLPAGYTINTNGGYAMICKTSNPK